MIHYSNCPVCEHKNIKYALTVTDFTVSKESFEIWSCRNCGLRFTQNAPDAESISSYYKSEDYISHTDTHAGLINKLYHSVRKVTLKNKRSIIEKYTGKKAGGILDLGCGTGSFLNTMSKSGWQVKGLEPDEQAAAISKKLYGIEPLVPEALFELPEKSFDAITMWHVLEHVHDLNDYLEKLRSLLKPQGKLFVAVPNYTSFDAGYYKEFWAAYDVPRHLYHFAPLSMKILLQKHGLRQLAIKPMWYDSFYVSMLSEKYKTNSSGVLSGAMTGVLSNVNALINRKKASSLIYISE